MYYKFITYLFKIRAFNGIAFVNSNTSKIFNENSLS